MQNAQKPEQTSLLDLSSREICFVLIQFKTNEQPVLSPMIVSTIEFAEANGGTVDTIVSNLMVVGFGMLNFSPLAGYKQFIESVLAKFGENAKIAYAIGVAKVGNLGSEKRMSFSFIHPAFPKALAELSIMPGGKAHEVK